MNNKFGKILLVGFLLPVFALACNLAVPLSEVQEVLPTEINLPEELGFGDIQNEPPLVQEQPKESSEPARVSNPVVEPAPNNLSFSELYERVNPAVVNIITYGEQAGRVIASGQGSGFLFDFDGNIITNAHVVHGSQQVETVFADGTIKNADIVGEDLHSDLAVIRVDEVPEGVQPIPLGDIEDVRVGQTVIAIGNPFGLGGTLTSGIVSALGRTIPALTPFSIPESIQTDAAINPGNSGGPLLNLRGEVIGVNAQIETDGFSRSNSGVGFAIPVSIVNRVVPELIKDGEFNWVWLGVVGGDVSPNLAEAMGLPVDYGAYISEVVEDGPAAQSGLHGSLRDTVFEGRQLTIGGDVITAINGVNVDSFGDLLVYIAMNVMPGDEVSLTVFSDGKYEDIKVTLQERPEQLDISEVQFP